MLKYSEALTNMEILMETLNEVLMAELIASKKQSRIAGETAFTPRPPSKWREIQMSTWRKCSQKDPLRISIALTSLGFAFCSLASPGHAGSLTRIWMWCQVSNQWFSIFMADRSILDRLIIDLDAFPSWLWYLHSWHSHILWNISEDASSTWWIALPAVYNHKLRHVCVWYSPSR